MYIIKLWGLILILTIAGVIHLASPQTFLIVFPDFIPLKIPIIIVTGILEILLVIGLALPEYRNTSAILTACYFFAIWPVHIYMAIGNIPLGTLDSPGALWGRVLLQILLIYWAYSLRRPTLR